MRNRALGTITALHRGADRTDDAITVAFHGIGIINVPLSYLDQQTTGRRRHDAGLDHAYAVTSYAVQGATQAVSTSRIDPGSTRAETYVDITRGQADNHLYLTRPPDPLDGEALPAVPQPPSTPFTRRLARSTGETTAWDSTKPPNNTNSNNTSTRSDYEPDWCSYRTRYARTLAA